MAYKKIFNSGQNIAKFEFVAARTFSFYRCTPFLNGESLKMFQNLAITQLFSRKKSVLLQQVFSHMCQNNQFKYQIIRLFKKNSPLYLAAYMHFKNEE